jgi:hypothetical protein
MGYGADIDPETALKRYARAHARKRRKPNDEPALVGVGGDNLGLY